MSALLLHSFQLAVLAMTAKIWTADFGTDGEEPHCRISERNLFVRLSSRAIK